MSDHEGLINLIHREVLRVLHRSTRRSPGIVDSYDPDTHAVKLKLMPDSVDDSAPVLTGWLALHPLQTGNSFGWHMPPNIGDPFWAEFHDDDHEAGQATLSTFNDNFKPVNTVQAGEWFYKHKQGASIYYKNDGSVTLTDKAGQTIQMDGTGKITITDKAGDTVILTASSATVKAAGGNEIVLDNAGNVQVKPQGGTVFLGGTGSDGDYELVLTMAGPAANTKAKI